MARIFDAIDASPTFTTLFIVIVALGVVAWEIRKENRRA